MTTITFTKTLLFTRSIGTGRLGSVGRRAILIFGAVSGRCGAIGGTRRAKVEIWSKVENLAKLPVIWRRGRIGRTGRGIVTRRGR